MNKKLKLVKEFIVKKGFVSTKELSKHFEVSEQTTRKYLSKLEEAGQINRVHGGAESKSTFSDRLSINTDSKMKLSKACAKIVNDNDTIYIDSGSTYHHLVDYLPEDIKVNIITNSIPTATRIKEKSKHKIFLIGGYIDDITYGTYSTDNFKQISSIIFDKAFFGTSGFSLDYEFTENNFDFLDFQNQIRKNSITSIIAAGSEKEGLIASKKSFSFSDIDIFITETEISEDMKNAVKNKLKLILI